MSNEQSDFEEMLAVHEGWKAAEVDPSELVDDDWIAANTRKGKRPSKVRAAGRKALPATLQRGGLSRDQMRRIAQRTGYPYTEAWSGHNKGAMSGVWGVLCHHTGTPWSAQGDYPTLRVVRDGRSDLVNSLSAYGLGKSGRIYLISEKRSWHAGKGEYNGVTDGAGYLIGIEAESDGGAGHWTREQVDAYPKLVASILVEINQDERYTTRHASWALPRGRKTDFGGWPGGPEAFWAAVRHWRMVYSGQAPPPPPPPPPPPSGEPWRTYPQLRQGARGPQVRRLQEFMVSKFGAYNKYTPDGDFGPRTHAGMVEFQRRVGLGADGIVGPMTNKKLFEHGYRA
jgi:peptidoglycan hydrolase-like protein with peptidoglycan-binding domain